MSKPSAHSETPGEAPPPTWSSASPPPLSSEWLKRTPICAPPDYPTTNMELCDPVGKQFKRKHPDKHEERVVCRLDTVSTFRHQDLILCEAVLEFDSMRSSSRRTSSRRASRLQVPRPSIARLRAAVPASAGVRS